MMRILLIISCYLGVLSAHAGYGDDQQVIYVQPEYTQTVVYQPRAGYQFDANLDPFEIFIYPPYIQDGKGKQLLEFNSDEKDAIEAIIKNARIKQLYVRIYENEQKIRILENTNDSLPPSQFLSFNKNLIKTWDYFYFFKGVQRHYYMNYPVGSNINELEIYYSDLYETLDNFIKNANGKIEINILGLKNRKKQQFHKELGLHYFIRSAN